jgi:ABC-type transporter Mla subunit MlaD
MAKDSAVSKPKINALTLLLTSINKAKEQLIADPASASSFLAVQKRAQEDLVRALSGAPDAGELVRRLADGELRLDSLSEHDLVALRRSPLAHAISLKL